MGIIWTASSSPNQIREYLTFLWWLFSCVTSRWNFEILFKYIVLLSRCHCCASNTTEVTARYWWNTETSALNISSLILQITKFASSMRHYLILVVTIVKLVCLWVLKKDSLWQVPKQSKRDETTLFLNEKGTKRTFVEKLTSFWASPRSKCYLLMVRIFDTF